MSKQRIIGQGVSAYEIENARGTEANLGVEADGPACPFGLVTYDSTPSLSPSNLDPSSAVVGSLRQIDQPGYTKRQC
uniref:Uncharacterized protein n=1 Tax=Oryza brachyantha TaxID=4533 RepID=J3N1L2_ORYBR